MYLGEARLNYGRMGELIKVVKDLAVKEISNGVEIPNMDYVFIEKTVLYDEEKNENNMKHFG